MFLLGLWRECQGKGAIVGIDGDELNETGFGHWFWRPVFSFILRSVLRNFKQLPVPAPT
jgi:hypothetical protein